MQTVEMGKILDFINQTLRNFTKEEYEEFLGDLKEEIEILLDASKNI